MAGGGGEVKFGGKVPATFGVIGGVIIAVVTPALVLLEGEQLGVAAQVVIIILALLIGGVTTGLAAVLGVVIPQSAAGGGKMHGAFSLNLGKKKDKDAEAGEAPPAGDVPGEMDED